MIETQVELSASCWRI